MIVRNRRKPSLLFGLLSTFSLLFLVLYPVRADLAFETEVRPPKLEERVKQAVDAIAACTVHVDTDDGMGSGTIVDKDGHILTSAHVVEGATSITVTLSDRRRLRAKVQGMNGKGDLAVLKIDAANLVPARLGHLVVLKGGDWVVAAGHPATAFDDYQPTMSIGRIRRLHARIRADGGKKVFRDTIVSDAPLSAGASGGGLFDLDGRLIGVNAAVSRGESQSYTVPLAEFVRDRERLVKGDRFDRVASRGSYWRRDRRSASRETWFDRHFSPMDRLLRRRTVELRIGGRDLRGFVVSKDGEVLTLAAPLIGHPRSQPVPMVVENERFDARLLAVDRGVGVALLKLPDRKRPYHHFGVADRPVPQRGVLAMTRGISSLRGGIVGAHRIAPSPVITGGIFYPELIQIDLRMDRRSLGAPVVGRSDDLLGMVVQHRLVKNDQGKDPYGGFLLSSRALVESLVQLRERGDRALRPVGFFGVELIDMTEADKKGRGLTQGVLVGRSSIVDGPAMLGGLRPGDVIVGISGRSVDTRQDAIVNISGQKVGREIPVTVRRRKETRTLNVRVGDRWDYVERPYSKN